MNKILDPDKAIIPEAPDKRYTKKKFFNRENREEVRKIIRKATSVARAGLEIYFAVKKKDPISLGFSMLSSYDAIENILTKEGETPHQKITSMGYTDVVRGMEKLVHGTLIELRVPYETKFSEKNESGNSTKIFQYDVCGSKVFVITDGTYIDGIYAKDEDSFIESFSKLLRSSLGDFISINVFIENWAPVIKLSSLDIPLETYVSTIDEEQYCSNIKKFRQMGLNRSSLLYGNPGSGKTTMAAKIAKNLEGKLIVIDSLALSQACRQGWSLIFQRILKLLSPTVVLFDDIDRLGDEELGFLLGMIENLNRFKENGEVIIMASINDISQLPDAMKRPGRFDEIIIFDNPDFEQRKVIISTYLKYFQVRLADMYVDEMSRLSAGLSPAYLKEIAQQAAVGSYDRIPGIISSMKIILGIDECDEEFEEDEEDEEIYNTARDRVNAFAKKICKPKNG